MITDVSPVVDCGRRPAKAVQDEMVPVAARVFTDGRKVLRTRVRWRSLATPDAPWQSTPLTPGLEDWWHGHLTIQEIGPAEFVIEGWEDAFQSWRNDLVRRIDAGMDAEPDIDSGWGLLETSLRRLRAPHRFRLAEQARTARASGRELQLRFLTDETLSARLSEIIPVSGLSRSTPLSLWVERPRALYGAWYELFPRSQGSDGVISGTLLATADELPAIADMGFDVVYLPPIHPIGHTGRRGRNNSQVATDQDPGSPWAIGSEMGGHTAIHPDLGSLDDFRTLLEAATSQGLEIALDYALQCSPDHPWVTAHPEWFAHRPDGSIRAAENPPKRYDDIYPLDFGCRSWRSLWEACYGILEFWIEQGVHIFRVDNPHTKPVAFWGWVVRRLHRLHPEVILLAEAFTSPAMMRELAKVGFSQSYTYFTWRTTKDQIAAYLAELSRESVDYLRPNLFINTPDILTEELQRGGPGAFRARLVLGATLGASYGIYSGFDLAEGTALHDGSEEYLDSEKYQLRPRDFSGTESLRPLVSRVNQIRREHRSLQQFRRLDFHWSDDPALVCYSKSTPSMDDVVLVVVNLDPWSTHESTIHLDLSRLGLADGDPFLARELLSGEDYVWQGPHQFVRLNPARYPAHILWCSR